MIYLNSAILQWLRHVCIAATLMAVKQHLIGFVCSMFCALMTYVTEHVGGSYVMNKITLTYSSGFVGLFRNLNTHQLKYLLLVQHNKYTRFLQIVSRLELLWLFSGWDVFVTSLDIVVHVLATHDTSCKWLRLLSWL